MNGAVRSVLNLDAQPAQARQRRPAVRTWGKMGERRATLGQGREQRVTVRDRLVAGHTEPAAQPAGGRDCGSQRGRHGDASDLTLAAAVLTGTEHMTLSAA